MTRRSAPRLEPDRVRVLASGLGFTESPVWGDLGRLHVASVNRGVVYEVFLDSAAPVQFAETGGGPNGLTGSGTDLLVCQNGGLAMPTKSALRPPPGIQRVDEHGIVTMLASGPFTSPSDCTMGPDGFLWFTDPADHALDDSAQPGRVWRMDTATGKAEVVVDDILFPNGIAFSPDGTAVYVAESATRRVLRFTADSTGRWSRDDWNCRPLDGVPDGLTVDAAEHVWVACSFSGKVARLAPDGELVGVLSLGTHVIPTAVCFAGAELDQLVVTSAKGGSVIALPGEVPGARALLPAGGQQPS